MEMKRNAKKKKTHKTNSEMCEHEKPFSSFSFFLFCVFFFFDRFFFFFFLHSHSLLPHAQSSSSQQQEQQQQQQQRQQTLSKMSEEKNEFIAGAEATATEVTQVREEEEDGMERLKRTGCARLRFARNETAPIRNPLYGYGPLPRTDDERLQTPLDVVRMGAALHPESPLFGTRDASAPGHPYVFRSYRESLRRIYALASGIRATFGIRPGDRIGVFSRTREEFHVLLFVCGVLRCVVVPIYESIGPNAVSYIIRHSGVRVIFAADDKLELLQQCLDALDARCATPTPSPSLSRSTSSTSMDPNGGCGGNVAAATAQVQVTTTTGTTSGNATATTTYSSPSPSPEKEEAMKARAVRAALREVTHAEEEGADGEGAWARPAVVTLDGARPGLAQWTLADVLAAGADAPEPRAETLATADDVHVIMYTSGTTGVPKGVMLTHGATLGSGMAIAQKIPKSWKNVQLTVLSFMPLAHVFGLAIDYTVLRTFGCIGFYSGDIRNIVSDIQALQPTALGGVPRVYQRIYDAVMAEVKKQNVMKRFAFNMAYMQKLWWLRAGQRTPYTDPMFFGAIRDKLGGRLKILVSGGAALPSHVMEWFRVVVCDYFLEGYGSTETCAIALSTDEDPSVVVNAGQYAPFFTAEVKLVSVPEMNYLVTDDPPRGELCVRTTTMMLGYYKDRAKTDEVIDADGWLHTGDVALLQPNNRVRIIDRMRAMFKLSQGEYLSAEYIEQVLANSPAIRQAYVCGNSTENFPIAVVVPDAAYFQEWATLHGLEDKAGDLPALCREPAVVELVRAEVRRVSKESKLKGYEFVKNVHLFPANFEDCDDFMTPSLKLKRHVLRHYFQDVLDQLYKEGPTF